MRASYRIALPFQDGKRIVSTLRGTALGGEKTVEISRLMVAGSRWHEMAGV